MSQAHELLKGTELLKKQLQELALMSRRDAATGDIVISPPTLPPPLPPTPPPLVPQSLGRSISDNNYLTVKLTPSDEFSRGKEQNPAINFPMLSGSFTTRETRRLTPLFSSAFSIVL